MDIRNDPLGVPNIYMHRDPQRPYVSVALPDGGRRFEFMIFEDETEEQVTTPERMAELLAKVLPATGTSAASTSSASVFKHPQRPHRRALEDRPHHAGRRRRAHHARVVQGQGYNTGMRDATNLAWKLASMPSMARAATRSSKPTSRKRLLHKAMIDLSVTGRAHLLAAQRLPGRPARRDDLVLNYIPPAQALLHGDALGPMPFLRERPGGGEKCAARTRRWAACSSSPRCATALAK